MIHLKQSGITLGLGVFLIAGAWAQTVTDTAEAVAIDSAKTTTNNTVKSSTAEDIVYTPIGYGGMEVGQIASGYFRYPGAQIRSIGHVWHQRAYSNFGYKVLFNNRLEINISGGGLIAYSTPQLGTDPQTMQTRDFFFFKTAFAAYSFGGPENISFKAQLGYFPYKYNPDVRNLGEYLFRSNAYPLLVYSDFDYPQADILGARFNFQLKIRDDLFHFQNDVMLHSDLYTVPVQDWSLSDVMSARFYNSLSVGFGASLTNLFSVYQGQYGTDWAENNYYAHSASPIILRSLDHTDSAVFDWKSVKLMARLAFDPKKFIPINIFGKNDLILYSEADVIGLKNYPQYDNLANRIFYTLGFNIPGFKVFDVVNAEIEYCSDTSAYSDEGLYPGTGTPNLYPSAINAASTMHVKRNPLRLSAYIKKSILNGRVSFIAQCARDHKKINFYYYLRSKMSFMETLPATDNWWWVFKTEFTF
jgi:hypothetical protein